MEQFDTLIPTLTVGEMLLYTAELKRSISEPLSSKQEAVDELLKRLALESCKDVVVRGCWGALGCAVVMCCRAGLLGALGRRAWARWAVALGWAA